MIDYTLRRIARSPSRLAQRLDPIPWPAGTAPSPATSVRGNSDSPLPLADALIVTYTEAEGYALADVLTPGRRNASWRRYTEAFGSYEPQLTSRSPARESRDLGSYWVTEIAGRSAVVFKSSLHLATDATSLPICQLWRQMIAEVQPHLVITTGTAGGIGAGTQLGDVLITGSVRWDLQGSPLSAAAFAQDHYQSPFQDSSAQAAAVGQAEADLIPVNGDRLPSGPLKVVWDKDVLTCDAFLFDTSDDAYGLRACDPNAMVEEMDDAALPLALGSSPVPWVSVRNASDPQIPSAGTLAQQAQQAQRIYDRWGYTTSLGSAICCWALVSAL